MEKQFFHIIPGKPEVPDNGLNIQEEVEYRSVSEFYLNCLRESFRETYIPIIKTVLGGLDCAQLVPGVSTIFLQTGALGKDHELISDALLHNLPDDEVTSLKITVSDVKSSNVIPSFLEFMNEIDHDGSIVYINVNYNFNVALEIVSYIAKYANSNLTVLLVCTNYYGFLSPKEALMLNPLWLTVPPVWVENGWGKRFLSLVSFPGTSILSPYFGSLDRVPNSVFPMFPESFTVHMAKDNLLLCVHRQMLKGNRMHHVGNSIHAHEFHSRMIEPLQRDLLILAGVARNGFDARIILDNVAHMVYALKTYANTPRTLIHFRHLPKKHKQDIEDRFTYIIAWLYHQRVLSEKVRQRFVVELINCKVLMDHVSLLLISLFLCNIVRPSPKNSKYNVDPGLFFGASIPSRIPTAMMMLKYPQRFFQYAPSFCIIIVCLKKTKDGIIEPLPKHFTFSKLKQRYVKFRNVVLPKVDEETLADEFTQGLGHLMSMGLIEQGTRGFYRTDIFKALSK
ncbi:hypothetical protein PCE1_000978 [Barthelona sp. PCE]